MNKFSFRKFNAKKTTREKYICRLNQSGKWNIIFWIDKQYYEQIKTIIHTHQYNLYLFKVLLLLTILHHVIH